MKKNQTAVLVNKMNLCDQEVEIGQILMDNRDEAYQIIGFGERNGYKFVIVMDGARRREIGESDIENYYHIESSVDYDEAEKMADSIIKGELPLSDLIEKENESDNSLMVVNADMYLRKRDELMKMSNKVEVIQRIIKSKTEVIKRNIGSIVAQYNTVISKLNKVIFTLELYAGISESIKQIQSGNPASDDEPIYLMQAMKYMDEEVGDPSNGGVSYNSIEQFDEWLLSYNKFLGYYNYNLLIPYKKGVRIMRVRRNASEKYTQDSFRNSWYIQQEMNTYVIIRNGENFYTVDSRMQFSEKLFPDVKELTDFYEKGGDFFDSEKMEHYKHGMILMQGLVDRTNVFGNIMGQISFLKNASVEEGKIVFHYENDDKLITDGSLTALDFLNTSTIEAGDRILVYNPSLGYNGKRLYKEWFQNEYRMPPRPDDGIYKLEYDKSNNCLYFRYNPKDTVWSAEEGSHERKKGFSYRIYPSDDFIVNIDIVSHKNIQWIETMMYDRRDRKKYLRAAGLLKAVQFYKRKELQEEEPFKNMVISVCKVEEEVALDAIHWWKTKNKHKRPLFIDDTKALRMISKKIKSDES